MKFAVAAAALAAGVAAVPSNVTYTTEVVTAYTTYCPAPTQITHNGQTYTVTSATTLTITNCPCTISKPVYSTSYVSCQTCAPAPAPPASYPASSAPPSYPTTYPNTTVATSKPVAPTGGVTVTPSGTATPVPTAGAGKAAALSGAGLAGVLGLVAYVL